MSFPQLSSAVAHAVPSLPSSATTTSLSLILTTDAQELSSALHSSPSLTQTIFTPSAAPSTLQTMIVTTNPPSLVRVSPVGQASSSSVQAPSATGMATTVYTAVMPLPPAASISPSQHTGVPNWLPGVAIGVLLGSLFMSLALYFFLRHRAHKQQRGGKHTLIPQSEILDLHEYPEIYEKNCLSPRGSQGPREPQELLDGVGTRRQLESFSSWEVEDGMPWEMGGRINTGPVQREYCGPPGSNKPRYKVVLDPSTGEVRRIYGLRGY